MNKDSARTTGTEAGADGAENDVQSDPAKDTDGGSDWSDEGGATPAGPATDSDASTE